MNLIKLAITLLLSVAATTTWAQQDPKGDCTDPKRDIVNVTTSQTDGNLVVKISTAEAGDFATFLIFFDTDTNPATGFNPPADPKYGFELLVSGDQLLKHTGATRDAWTWESIGAVKRQVAGNTLTLAVDASLIGSKTADLSVWSMSQDWMTLLDRAPDEKPTRLSIKSATTRPAQTPATMAAPKANRQAAARQRVKEAKSYYCYYGSGKVEELSHYDVAVLHTPQMAPEDVKRLKDIGVVTVGYISVGEDEPPQPRKGDGSGPGGFASWYFDKNADGQPDMNPIWRSYYTNANDPNWRADRVAEAKRLVNDYGFDGIFLDTIDTASANPETMPGMVQLVKDLRAAFPDAPIVLNQGFPLLPQLAPLADALMIESYTATYDFDSKTYMMNFPQSIDYHLMRTQKDILPVLAKYPLRVFILDYAPENETQRIQEAANRAATFGFLFAASPISLDAVYANNVVGKPDPKWLNKLTTPELLSYKMPQAINGFPTGTMLVPSGAFAGYKVDVIVDGVADRSGMHWSKAAWASAEDGSESWLEFRFPESRAGGSLVINWEPSHPSRTFTIQTKTDSTAAWKDAKAVTENAATSTSISLPSESYRVVRIHQSVGGGSVNRPDLMWVAQVYLK